ERRFGVLNGGWSLCVVALAAGKRRDRGQRLRVGRAPALADARAHAREPAGVPAERRVARRAERDGVDRDAGGSCAGRTLERLEDAACLVAVREKQDRDERARRTTRRRRVRRQLPRAGW